MENKNICHRCGKCCTTKGLMKQSSLFEKIIYRIVLISRNGLKGFKNPQCPHLKFRSRNAYCSIYETRPQFCREFFCEKSKNN